MSLRAPPNLLLTLDRERCRGCTHCLRVCPTEAIRIRKGKAAIMVHRCVHCGECLRACPQGAWALSLPDGAEMGSAGAPWTRLDPAAYWQFGGEADLEGVVRAFEKAGFPPVKDISLFFEAYRFRVREYLASPGRCRPAVSATCPAVVEFVRVKYPSLIENLVPLVPPAETILEGEEAFAGTSAPNGIYVSPCLAHAEIARSCAGSRKAGARPVPIARIYNRVKAAISPRRNGTPEARISEAFRRAMGWAAPGGESAALDLAVPFVVAGLERVGKILDRVEAGRLEAVPFIEAWACSQGCLGGPLTVEDPSVAAYHLNARMRTRERTETGPGDEGRKYPPRFRAPLTARPGLRLDENVKTAMEKLRRIDEILKRLPGIDCGSCGSPTCLSLAEDIVQGSAEERDCLVLAERGGEG